MPSPSHDGSHACPKKQDRFLFIKKHSWARWLFPIAGLLSLIWFLVRVLPKPSRAAYPCQRVAAPLAGSFVLWLAGVLASLCALRKGRKLMRQSRRMLALACLVLAAMLGAAVFVTMPGRPALADNPVPNAPIGVAKGVHPGRVVWAHDPNATDWLGPGNGHWWESSHTNQAAVNAMMSGSLRSLTGARSDREAWDMLFRSFNKTHGLGDVGYRPGEKVAIKINMVGCIVRAGSVDPAYNSVDPATYNMKRWQDYMNTSPQMMMALLGQLVNTAGVPQAAISMGDPLSLFPNEYYDMVHREFPEVHYLDHDGGNADHPRTAVHPSTVPFYWSARPTGMAQDFVPDFYAEAKYLINLANLKSHLGAGVTLCAKNHYGSLIREPAEKGYYDMHKSLATFSPDMGRYRALVDLMGHAHLGGKTMLYLIDGLYAGVHPIERSPKKWNTPPFNGDWTSSLFASQDPVAIDSVAFDFLWAEWTDLPHMPGADDYLHEAALANDPPSGTFYDPNHAGNVSRLASMGVHEHWNNAQSRQYTRNLGTGNGIEMLRVGPGNLENAVHQLRY